MAATSCVLCGIGFAARSDARYCSSACRQKAHRDRTARRIAALGEHLRRSSRPAPIKLAAARSMRRAAAGVQQRARAHIDQSQELCRTSAERIREAAAIQQQFAEGRAL
ncbi:MAG: hypothetical protein ACRDTV_05175 [Mycobacterium sp.]